MFPFATCIWQEIYVDKPRNFPELRENILQIQRSKILYLYSIAFESHHSLQNRSLLLEMKKK